MWKELVPRIVMMICVSAAIVGMLFFYAWLDDQTTRREIELIAPMQQVLDGRVEKFVSVETYSFEDESSRTLVTFFLCSGETWTPLESQVQTVQDWLNKLAPHKGCK